MSDQSLCRCCGQTLPPPEAAPDGPHPGIHWEASRQRWRAKIKRGGRVHYVGRFRRLSDAIQAREAALATLPPPSPKRPPVSPSAAPERAPSTPPARFSLTDLLAKYSKEP